LTGQTGCLDANVGYYVDASGSATQTPCTPGNWNNITGQIACSPCPTGTYNPNNSSTDVADCITSSPGYFAAGSYQNEGFESGNLIGLFDNWSISSSRRNSGSPTNYSGLWQPTNPGECNTNNTLWCIQSNYSLNGGYSLRVGDDYYTNGSFQSQSDLRASIHLHVDFPHATWFNFSYRVSSEGTWDHLNFCVRNTTGEVHCEHPQITRLIGSDQPGGIGPTDPANSTWKRSWSSNITAVNNTGNASGDFSILIPAGEVTITWTYAKDSSVSRWFDSAWIDNITAWSPSGSPNQTECAPGTYQNMSGQISCNEADPGYFVLDSASTTQTGCLLGTYQPLPGQSGCLNASAGY